MICWSVVDVQCSVLSGCSHLLHLLHIRTEYLFSWGFFCHRSYCRRMGRVPCAEYLACGLSISNTYFSVFVNPDLLTHPRPFTFVCVCNLIFVFEFWECPFVLYISFFVYLYTFCLRRHHRRLSPLSLSVWSSKVHPCGITSFGFSWLSNSPLHTFTTSFLIFNLLVDILLVLSLLL